MITSVEDFLSLCASSDPLDTQRSISESAPCNIWIELVDNHRGYRADVAQNRTIPDEIIRALAACDDDVVRSIIAERRKLPPDLFSILAKDDSEIVRRVIASNKKTPDDVLMSLTSDPVNSVASVAAYSWKMRSKPTHDSEP